MRRSRKPTGAGLGTVAALGFSVILGGCDSFSAIFSSPSPPPPPQAAAAAPALPLPPPRKPATPAVAVSPAAPAVANTPTTPTVVPLPEEESPDSPPPSGFDKLKGLDELQLTAVLGEPIKRVDAPPATKWIYQGQACDLEVYFYFDLESQAMRTLHYEVRSHESREQPAQQCYDELVRERRAGAESATGTDRSR